MARFNMGIREAIRSACEFILSHSNFYRIHMTVFVIVPLLTSVIFFYSNGEYHVTYIDSLFVCYSAATVTGLATIDLSKITLWQQVILFLLMFCGSTAAVSIVLIVIRRRFFHQKFKHVIEEDRRIQAKLNKPKLRSARSMFSFRGSSFSGAPQDRVITRVDSPARVNSLNPSGAMHSRSSTPVSHVSAIARNVLGLIPGVHSDHIAPDEKQEDNQKDVNNQTIQTNNNPPPLVHFPLDEKSAHLHQSNAPLSQTSQIPPSSPKPTLSPSLVTQAQSFPMSFPPRSPTFQERRGMARSMSIDIREPTGIQMDRERNITRNSHASHAQNSSSNPSTSKLRNKHKSFGGFPSLLTIALRIVRYISPSASNKLKRATTMPYDNSGAISLSRYGTTSSYVNAHPNINYNFKHNQTDSERPSNSNEYGSAIVGRNSMFHGLTAEEADQLGGVEYRALHLLAYIILAYYFGLIMIGVVVIAPYCSLVPWVNGVINNQPGSLSPAWFGIFDVVSAFSNAGLSLLDSSLLDLQKAYPLIITIFFLILAGNTAYPIFLRFFIWIAFKLAPQNSQTKQTLSFILDHPRRCFIYLFPSIQTWFLLTVLVSMILTDWVSFLILDLGNEAIDSIPVGTRIIAGFLQSAAVRAAGFGIVSLSALAPAVQVLYLVMMYISIYPIAMSVRATNVYEERSLGVFEEEPSDEEPQNLQGSKRKVWGAYLGWHLRRQLAFDIWSLAFALWIICIAERAAINDVDKPYINIFSLLFEVVSAYGTVGLSLGVPFDFFSLSGDLTTISKLIICVVMIRGRHRGLPIAVDRAILLPGEVAHVDKEENKLRSDFGTTSISSQTRHSRLNQSRSFVGVADDLGSLHDRAGSLHDDSQSFGLHRRGLNRGSTFESNGPQSPNITIPSGHLSALEEVKESGLSRSTSTTSLTVESNSTERKQDLEDS